MTVQSVETNLRDVVVLEPKVFRDDRGFFFESYSARSFLEATGLELDFVQDNHSRSERNVLRGLHYQLPPMAQGKLVRCTSGAIWDVAVDVRTGSDQRGEWFGVELSESNFKQLWIPPGFAHGFLVLSANADVQYKATAEYAPSLEASIKWSDPALSIAWPISGTPIVSEKDEAAPVFEQATMMESG